MEPLASRLRPSNIDEVIGQKHIVGEGKILSSMIGNKKLLNMLFYGPPGTGKTTIARLLADLTDRQFFMLNASTDSLKDVREVLDQLNTMMGYQGIILYIDEIHMFNKRNQQVLLDYIEDGRVILIGSTTENPHFAVFKALVSRCLVIEFKPLDPADILKGLDRGMEVLRRENSLKEFRVPKKVLGNIAAQSDGDMRKGLNALEMLFISRYGAGSEVVEVTEADAEALLGRKMLNYDSDGDSHYDLLSAFHKSVRGSDPDAAIVYLAMMLKGGDLLSVSRRLLCIANEDIGLAYPMAIPIVKAAVDTALQLGMPEALLPLSNATVLLCTAPKSNSAPMAYWTAAKAIEQQNIGEIPADIRDGHYSGAQSLGRAQHYKYPHSFPGHWVAQQYMPTGLTGQTFYEYGDNKMEDTTRKYWEALKAEVLRQEKDSRKK
ncbi:replication-associated recombination protein A [Proteiniclasticum sp. QWL-01]|uniref:replication-associated recombination protein A n=1 Tax=Proteiniclasticum sp. QWL-01 TaxID=3036945 RepID=UPI0024110861|nr:replication-associated recombination protein A [Proteiniclasticum sp. QWL-01]WFF74466.1 replication-associated recombination protein A [Proteiniclasticum sp. QWL-01]